jgi:hypothetical protein
MRSIVVHLTIAALLVCPFECALRLAAAQGAGDERAAACCGECPESAGQPSSPDRVPTPAPAEDGKSCVCEGAIVDAGARPGSSHDWPSCPLGPIADDAATRAWPGRRCFDRTAASPVESGGRVTRLAICSLLL